jgi:hypothetical protein
MAPYQMQAIFHVPLKAPSASTGSASASEVVIVGCCLPHGYSPLRQLSQPNAYTWATTKSAVSASASTKAAEVKTATAAASASTSASSSDAPSSTSSSASTSSDSGPTFYISLHNLLLKESTLYADAFQSSLESRLSALAATQTNDSDSEGDEPDAVADPAAGNDSPTDLADN